MLPRRVSLGYATTLLGVFGALLNNLWLLAAVANEVSKSELGLYLFAAATIGYFALAQLGLDAASAQRIAESLGRNEPEQAARIYRQLDCFNRGVSLLAALLTTVVGIFTWFLAPLELRDVTCWIVAATGFGTALRLLANPARAALNGAQNVHIVGTIGLLSNLLTPLLGYVLLKLGIGVLCLPFSQFVTALLVLVIVHLQRVRTCPWTRIAIVDRWLGFRSLFRFGVGVSGSIGLAMIVATCEPVLFKLVSSQALLHVAVYYIWLRFPAMTFVLSSGLLNNAGPALATAFARNHDAGILFFRRILWISTGIGAVSTFAIAAWLVPVVHHWLEGKYDLPGGQNVALGFGALVGLHAIMSALASVFYPLNRIRSVVGGYGIQAASKILLGLGLIALFSVNGMVWAYTLSTVLATVWLQMRLIRKRILSVYAAIGSLAAIVIATAAAAVLARFTKNLNLTEMATGIGLTAVLLLVGVVSVYRVAHRLGHRREEESTIGVPAPADQESTLLTGV